MITFWNSEEQFRIRDAIERDFYQADATDQHPFLMIHPCLLQPIVLCALCLFPVITTYFFNWSVLSQMHLKNNPTLKISSTLKMSLASLLENHLHKSSFQEFSTSNVHRFTFTTNNFERNAIYFFNINKPTMLI